MVEEVQNNSISPNKSEYIVFSPRRGNWRDDVDFRLGGAPLPYKDHVRLLGVMLDSNLQFNHHAHKLLVDVYLRMRQMMAICSTDWGSSTQDLRALDIAFIRSKILYVGPAYWHLLSKRDREKNNVMGRKVAPLVQRVRQEHVKCGPLFGG